MMAITKDKLQENLTGLKVDKLPGPDGLHPRVLKKIIEEIVEVLVVIFQESMDSGRVPEDWKITNEVMSRLDKREPMDVIYLDFQKALDKVLHRRLLSKEGFTGSEAGPEKVHENDPRN
eukprot:g40920.t1